MTAQPLYRAKTQPGRSPRGSRPQTKLNPLGYYLSRLMALVTLFNFGWVLFDITYIPFRDVYLKYLPAVTATYDRVKAIEPFRMTDQYLDQVNQLADMLETQPIDSAPARLLLQKLQQQSIEIVDTNPFQLANKSGTLEKIKNRMRDRLQVESSKDAFRQFWTVKHFQSAPDEPLRWFQRQIVPLVSTNYFRPIGENGRFRDYFWAIDIWFLGLFGLDLVIRTVWNRYRRPGLTWIDALLWRWYDLLLFIPIWRWLRVLPVLLRCHQVHWIRLDRIQKQLNQFLAENLVDELSELVLVRSFGVAQSAVRDGILQKWLQTEAEVVEINDVNEMQVIIERVLMVFVTKVLPQSHTELEAMVRHMLEQGLNQVPAYQGLKLLPGSNLLPQEIAKQTVNQLTAITSGTVQQVLQDERGQALSTQLAERVVHELRQELQDPILLNEIQSLLMDLLEEFKLTLIKSLEQQDVEETAAEVARLRQNQADSTQRKTVELLPSQPAIAPRRQDMR